MLLNLLRLPKSGGAKLQLILYKRVTFLIKNERRSQELREHKMGCAIYNEYINMKNQAKRRDWMAFYRSFVNQICPVLRYYVKLEEI